MTIHGASFSARSRAGNNDKTTVAGKGIFWFFTDFVGSPKK